MRKQQSVDNSFNLNQLIYHMEKAYKTCSLYPDVASITQGESTSDLSWGEQQSPQYSRTCTRHLFSFERCQKFRLYTNTRTEQKLLVLASLTLYSLSSLQTNHSRKKISICSVSCITIASLLLCAQQNILTCPPQRQ